MDPQVRHPATFWSGTPSASRGGGRARVPRIEAQLRCCAPVLAPHRARATPASGNTCASSTADGASPHRRRTPTVRTPSYAPAEWANAQLKTSRILRKLRCRPWRPGSSPKPSTSFKPARSEDENVQPSRTIARRATPPILPQNIGRPSFPHSQALPSPALAQIITYGPIIGPMLSYCDVFNIWRLWPALGANTQVEAKPGQGDSLINEYPRAA